MGKRALLLVNRHARQAEARLDEAVAALRECGLDLIEEPSEKPGAVADAVRRQRGRVDLAIVGGGDGTLNAAADGLAGSGLPLGVLPLGTANDLARTLNLPPDPAAAARVIAAGHTRRIDLGTVNGKHFFNVASIGLSTHIARRLTRAVKSRWGVLGYAFTAMRVLLQYRPFHAKIIAGGEVHRTRTMQISVGNGVYYGGGLSIAEGAAIDDGRLDLYSLEAESWWEVLRLLPALRLGRHAASRQVRALRGDAFDVVTRHRLPVNTDGEITTFTPARFRIARAALDVFVP